MVDRMAKSHPNAIAYELYGNKTSYTDFIKRIEAAARAFLGMGIRKNDAVTICMPNIPQSLDCFYALNRIGAVANMVHPQSAVNEISFYLNISVSKAILVPDMFYEKVIEALKNVDHEVQVIVARIQNELPLHLKLLYIAKAGKPYLKFPLKGQGILWSDFVKTNQSGELPEITFEKYRTAVILYSGGTTGIPKGICLTDLNFNALAMQAKAAIEEEISPEMKMLSCMPMFHGFGLGINIHTVLVHGARCILMPTFNPKTYADMIKKKKPNYIAGVPTIFEALLHMPQLDGVDLSFMKGMFCGGDSLSIELKKKIDVFLKEHHATIQVREGYGLTECVTASCLTPKDTYKPGSIGIPFPDTYYCVVQPGTDEELPFGEEGEIILRGPSVMTGYLKNEEETANTLRKLPDGNIWLYTGDLGKIDSDGYVYFRQRIKRMIVSNGYNIYPGQIENIIDSCDEVSYSCVIGVKDPRRMKRVRAYIVLKDGYAPSKEIEDRIMDTLKLQVAKYALPKEIFFRKDLPKTLVGKVAYRKLEEEAEAEG